MPRACTKVHSPQIRHGRGDNRATASKPRKPTGKSAGLRSTRGARRWESRRSGTSRRQRSAPPWLARLAPDVRTLISRHFGNVPPWHLGNRPPILLRSSGSILGHAIVWHRPRNDIGEPEDLADGKPVFGGSAHRPPPQRAEPGQCAGVNWLGSMMATTGDS
jgi:hypothetical protein